MFRQLRKRARLFARLRREALHARDAEARLYWVAAAATFAWSHNFGIWRDDGLESVLDEVAGEFAPAGGCAPAAGGAVHVVSMFGGGGGHAEALIMWGRAVGSAVVSSEWETSDMSGLGLESHLCPRGLPPAERVGWLCRKLCELRPETVILHIFPNDVAALAAALAYRRASGARLLLHDHADTSFWLGAGLVDRVVVCFPSRLPFARDARGVPPEKLSLVPLTSRRRDSAPVTRESLGVPPGATLSLTVGAFYKMRPDGHWDYARTLSRVMERHPRHYHLMVGAGAGGEEIRRRLGSERVLWLGLRTDVDALLKVSDFVVESFPLMGGLFRLDAMREGVPVLAVAHPRCPELFDTGAFPADYPLLARSNEEVERLCARLIEEEGLRRTVAASLRERFEEVFSEAAVARALGEALGGVPTPFADARHSYDFSETAAALSPGPCRLHAAMNLAGAALNYSPPLKGALGLGYRAAYVYEALKLRLRGLLSA